MVFLPKLIFDLSPEGWFIFQVHLEIRGVQKCYRIPKSGFIPLGKSASKSKQANRRLKSHPVLHIELGARNPSAPALRHRYFCSLEQATSVQMSVAYIGTQESKWLSG